MTILEKLQRYQQASDLLLSIPGFGWPETSLGLCVEETSQKEAGKRVIQCWYIKDTGWTVIELESWNENGERMSSKVEHEAITATQAAAILGES